MGRRSVRPTDAGAGVCVLADLDPAHHRPHALHGPQAAWLEKNCYVDLWIELLAALQLDPHALWPCTVGVDFEGDQWTFFKPSHHELRALYGIDVQELTVWRPLAEHALEHLHAGRLLSLEVDAYWLPDAAGTDYRRRHAKTTVVLNELDLAARRVGYFHNAGYFEAQGEDCARLLGLADPPALVSASDARATIGPGGMDGLSGLGALEAIADWRGERILRSFGGAGAGTVTGNGNGSVIDAGSNATGAAASSVPSLPLYAEFIRLQRRIQRPTPALQALALHHLASQLAFRPTDNPLRRFAQRLHDDLPALRQRGLPHYHLWAFAGVRQLGAAFDFAARGLAWHAPPPGTPLQRAGTSFDRLGRDAKTLILKLARAVASPRAVDLAPLLEGMAVAWDEGMAALDEALGAKATG